MDDPAQHAPNRLRWNLSQTREELTRLSGLAALGQYESVEVTELFGCAKGQPPFNVLSVLVLEERPGNTDEARPQLLNSERIKVRGIGDLTFGVQRFRLPLAQLQGILEAYEAHGVWAASGKPLGMGALIAERPEFAPPHGTVEVPLNGVLKNNFWNGSYVLALADPDKIAVRCLVEHPQRLQALSDAVSKYVPWSLSSLLDILGDVLIQIPATAVLADTEFDAAAGGLKVDLSWTPATTARPLRAAVDLREDQMIAGSAVSVPFTTETLLPVRAHLGGAFQLSLWDEETNTLVAALPPTSLLNQLRLEARISRPEPRVFSADDETGVPVSHEVKLSDEGHSSVIGDAGSARSDWRRRRARLEEIRRLEQRRDFVQYRPAAGDPSERRRALLDLRWLIEAHGDGGVWLWDPYLSADDLLQTLFFSPHADADLRALSAGRTAPGAKGGDFRAAQLAVMAQRAGNCEGLRLEYRTRYGPQGWEFHDRFLIFPAAADGPQAWSLGTSINSLGLAHHILQRVSNGALIAAAFDELWAALDQPQHLVWKSW